ncbi:MAG: nickel-dependent hydrogenase large subunit [Acidobacteria bacterium]|nr:nickel-dependent hydrogenase large subunit [Acidobacteriota bacterium]
MSVPYRVPQQSIGAGFWEDGQGILTHHTMIVDGRLFNYQIVAPSDWMGSAHPIRRPDLMNR